MIKNRTLFSLGVALLELNFGAPLSELRSSEDLDDAFSYYRTAIRLTEQVVKNELPRFASVVRECIHPTPEGATFSFENEGFRTRFFTEVISPLIEECEELYHPRLKAYVSATKSQMTCCVGLFDRSESRLKLMLLTLHQSNC